MKLFETLSEQDQKTLLKFPAYITLLAANSDGKLSEKEKKYAIKFSHIKTYTCDPMLSAFYKASDAVFEENVLQLDQNLPHEQAARAEAIKRELILLEKLVLKLGKDYTETMHRSMASFKDHVSKASRNVLMDFIFPMPMKGFTN